MQYNELKNYLNSEAFKETLTNVINCDDVDLEKQRYLDLLEKAYQNFGDGDYHYVSSPGRTEVGGNHTDHQHGHVLAAALNIDNVCIFKANDTKIVNYIYSRKNVSVDLSSLEINKEEANTSTSLIRGIASKISSLGNQVSGFDAVCDSHVLVGSGISSSACFEVMVAEIFNYLFCDNKLTAVDCAIIGQYAEREYFGKPSGLMDQTAISVGGFVAIDFKDEAHPVIENYDFSFDDYGYELLLVNTKGNHIDLSHEYAAVPNEIKEVGKKLGVDYLADTSYEKLIENFDDIRKQTNNDRGLLRSMHFFKEDKRAVDEKQAVKDKDIKKLLKLIKESGFSSFMYLQNVYPASRPTSQPLAIGLCLTANMLEDEGAYRVHGGGFDGTIQVIIPKDKVEEYKKLISPIFGDDAIMSVKIRQAGTKTII